MKMYLLYCLQKSSRHWVGFFFSLSRAISRHGGDARLVFSVTVHSKGQQHMGFLSPPRADNNQQIPQRIQCQRQTISIGAALWLMSFQCVVQWQCSYTLLIAIPRLRQRGQAAKAEEHSNGQNAKSSTHVHVTSPGEPRLIVTSTARPYHKTRTGPRTQMNEADRPTETKKENQI